MSVSKKTNYVIEGKKVSYEILDDGYKIKVDGEDWIHQYEPHIPDKSKSYKDNCMAQIKELVEAYNSNLDEISEVTE